MSATKSGVLSGLEVSTAFTAAEVVKVILSGNRGGDEDTLKELNAVHKAFLDRQPFCMELLKPETFGQFLDLKIPTQGIFNQLVSEIAWWVLLDQIEEACFLQPEKLVIARPFLVHLFEGEIAQKPYQPPKDWRYLPVSEAVERFRQIFGSSLKADSVLKHAKDTKPADSEGFLTALKLTTLAKLFGISGSPLEATEEGRVAYARIVELFVPKVGQEYVKAHSNKLVFANWLEGKLTSEHIVLTPAGRKTWQELESQSEDDFVIASADSGGLHAGYSQRKARIAITASGKQMPQDCIMTGSTLAIQPDRLCQAEHLRIDHPGNAYSPAAGGRFLCCVCWEFSTDDRKLGFDFVSAVSAYQSFGSAVLLRP